MPALADFMLYTHRGYCQMFSGAMALVLRLHGIPARVAVGFTSGKLRGSDTYVVNDRDAHAWVEVYFPGYGWIPFEPTPCGHLPTERRPRTEVRDANHRWRPDTVPGGQAPGQHFGAKGNFNRAVFQKPKGGQRGPRRTGAELADR